MFDILIYLYHWLVYCPVRRDSMTFRCDGLGKNKNVPLYVLEGLMKINKMKNPKIKDPSKLKTKYLGIIDLKKDLDFRVCLDFVICSDC